jgi:hypothetical protein
LCSPIFGCFRPVDHCHALAESLLSRVFSWDVVDVGFPTCWFIAQWRGTLI